jgi:serine O-acetyltransferase
VIKDVPPDTTVVGNPGRPVVISGRRVAGPELEHTRLPDPVAESLETLTRRITELEHQLGASQGGPEAAPGQPNGKGPAGRQHADSPELRTPRDG